LPENHPQATKEMRVALFSSMHLKRYR